MNLSPRQQARLHANLARLQPHAAARPLDAQARSQSLWSYLQTCEAALIALMNNQQPDVPQTELEWGLTLYFLNDPNYLSGEELYMLHTWLGMPTSNITPAQLALWKAQLGQAGVLYDDGTLVADTTWALFDPGWLVALTSYLVYYELPSEIYHPFPSSPAIVPLDGSRPITLGLISDWGTGPWPDGTSQGPALAVITQLKNQNPDILIHLGDTYYAGLGSEEQAGLLDPLAGWSKPAFTLNSNHEMYDGANGYFRTALASPLFQHQGGTSYFALTHNNIVVLGLDTAFFDTSRLYMHGALNDQHQLGFIKTLDLGNKTVIVLTHHNGLDVTGTQKGTPPLQPNPLWDQLADALGRPPDLWYWGHLHNGIVYTQTALTGPTRARCIGHAALPFGRAKVLYNPDGSYIPSVQFSASTPVPNPDPQQQHRVLNGYATLTLHPDGTLQETFYDQAGTQAWPTPTPPTPYTP